MDGPEWGLHIQWGIGIFCLFLKPFNVVYLFRESYVYIRSSNVEIGVE